MTGFAFSGQGALTLLDPNGVTGQLPSGGAPIDCDFTQNGRFLYVLDSGNDRINAFCCRNDGSLEALAISVDQVDRAAGLLAR